MSTNFAVIGGDKRIVELIKLLIKDKMLLHIYGLENSKDLKNNKNEFKIIDSKLKENSFKNTDIIIGPIPFSKDNININSPYSNEKIKIEDIFDKINGKILIAGSISQKTLDIAKERNIDIIDIMKNEKLAILNCIPTAEGAIETAISNTDRVIHGTKSLILGFGRVAKILAKKLQGLDVKVTCAARKEEAFAWIRAYGYDLININELGNNLSKFDIIFNTVPNLILDESKIKYLKQNCLLIELASRPGGIDRDFAKNNNIKVIDALALPGKVAPVTSAKYIEEAIFEILESK